MTNYWKTMCGILGIIAPDLTGIRAEEGLDAIRHRGPDTGGGLMENHAGKTVFFGHRRLSILDPGESGRQPMHCGELSIIYNGEVYNHGSLRRAHLKALPFSSRTDTEVIIRLYEKMGDAFLSHLHGDFALAILDRNRKKVLLARDPIGVKPLYIYRKGDVFAFASEIKAFQAAGLPLGFADEHVSDFLTFKYNPLNRTLFREVEKLDPGHALTYDFSDGRITTECFWDLDKHRSEYRGSLKNAAAELRERVDAAIEMRLMGDVPIANFLSGGLDSSIIAHALRDRDHVHYCAVKSEADLKREGTTSDGHYAEKLAASWQLDLRTVPIGLETLGESELHGAILAADELIADGSIIPAMLMAREAAKSHRVILSGMGADELFFGYNGHYLTRFNALVGAVPGVKPLTAGLFKGVSANKGAFKAYRRYVRKWGDNVGKPYEIGRFSVVGDVDASLRIQRRPGDPGEVFARYFDEGMRFGPFDCLFRFELDNFLIKNLHYLDGSTMAFGMESRVPFLDVDVVGFAAGLPTSFKIDHRFKAKKILKTAYADVLPPFILRRRKAGFGMPLRSILADASTLRRLMPYSFLEDSGLFLPEEVAAVEAQHLSGAQDHSALLYALICLGAWHRAFFGDSTGDPGVGQFRIQPVPKSFEA